MDLKDIFQNSVLNEVQEQNKKKSLTSQYEREVASAKKKKLAPVEEFLNMFVESKVYVKHKEYYSLMGKSEEPQLFSFYMGDSSKRWSPGVSIFIEHPEIEIAIPNHEDSGKIVIHNASHHPDSFLINQKFTSIESAIKALAIFLGRCVVKIEKPQAILTENSSTVNPLDGKEPKFFNNVPPNPKVKSNAQTTISKIFNENKDEE